jgi:hypothetical protein
MNTVKFFFGFGICLFSIILLYNLMELNKLEDRYNKALQEHNRLLNEIDKDSCKIDSLQNIVDSLDNRYKLFNSPPARDAIDLINAIMQVESRGNDNAYRASEDAVGVLQIRRVMVDDVNRILARQGSIQRYTYEDRWNRIKSIEMFNIFCDYYNLTSAEEIARGWNGGPRGINNPYTLGYWNKVQIELEEGYASR